MPINRWNLLGELIIKNRYKKIVEVGFSSGATTEGVRSILFSEHYPVEEYYGIDPFLDPYYLIDADRMKKFSYWLPWKFMKMTSDEAYRILKRQLEVDFVFIDGSHKPDQMCKDIENYGQLLRIGGCLAGHDYKNTVTHSIDGDYTKITDFLHASIGENNLNSVQDKRLESGKPVYLWWTYKVGEGVYAKIRPNQ